ncbi:hypothetical protein N5853_00755 [Bartonella sp. HY329]|uniref:hypothetical protein n=1 Tax=Bartonella sp. HY329 TaxID=2979321 RepID=UPI0021C979BE|nr:hypothetical protein [Bartonella sp. HY329]UXM95222.1 hypothetical protein N5853_00755 [Bartonella sp. HY329]
MNNITPNYKTVEVLKSNFLITDVWRSLLSFNRTWDNTICLNMTTNQNLMINDLKQDIRKFILLLPEINSKDWILLCNSCGWFPLSMVALSYCKEYLKEDIIHVLTQSKYLAALEYDDIISSFINETFLKSFDLHELLEEDIYLISVILRSKININGYENIKKINKNKINNKILPYVLYKLNNK